MYIRIGLTLLTLTTLFLGACSRTARDYYEKGNNSFESRKYQDAVIQYQKALQKDPNLGEAYYRIGLAEMEQDRGIQAYAPLLRAVQLMPANEAAKIKLADLSLALYVVAPRHPKALYDQIEKLADELLAKNKASFDGLRLKGSLRLLDRNPEEAITFFERASQLEPLRPDLV